MKKVIYIRFESNSFSWANGLYVIVKELEDEYHIVKLNEDGEIDRLENGEPNISITGKGNKGIHKTNLKYVGKL